MNLKPQAAAKIEPLLKETPEMKLTP